MKSSSGTCKSLLSPRRIGHVNLYVGDWLRSLGFYSTVAGLEEVFRESPIKAGFLSSGNTHHDIGFLEAQSGPRVGQGGFQQVAAGIGAQPAFNHFGIEMENEKDLVDAYWRLRQRNIKIDRLSQSTGLSKSIYLRDPDGNMLQFYADLTRDWRSFWSAGDRLVTGAWDPEKDLNPTSKAFYTVDPVQYHAPNAAFHPVRVTGGMLVVKDLTNSLEFYREVCGFDVVWQSTNPRVVVLSARKLNRDITLMQADARNVPGLRHLSFKISSLPALVDGWAALKSFGLSAEACLDHELCKSIYVRDPDGFLVEFYADAVEDWAQWLELGRPFDYPEGRRWRPEEHA